ncbi:hypothetical protein CC2G_001662 [Coprinopsis cinerea AmutBmut pab1-1]|nr:hypothetical protein CC2G_001662 [Coprinopsis cinerea AmutBmut pab1-1]
MRFVEQSLVCLVGVLGEAQSYEFKQVHGSVVRLAVKSFHMEPFDRDHPGHAGVRVGHILPAHLFHRRQQFHQTASTRFTYRVIGLYGKLAHIFLLTPMSLINLTIVLLLIAAILLSTPST